jgi:hypothetical protein
MTKNLLMLECHFVLFQKNPTSVPQTFSILIFHLVPLRLLHNRAVSFHSFIIVDGKMQHNATMNKVEHNRHTFYF